MNNTTKFTMLASLLLASGSTWAMPYSQLGVQNNNAAVFILSASSASKAHCNDNTCYPTLNANPKGGQQWVSIMAARGWIDLEYDICQSVSYPNGKANCVGYLGHVGIKLMPTATILSNVSGGQAQLGSYQVGKPFTVTFTPQNSPLPVFPKPVSYTTVPYRGINLAGGEFDYQFNLPHAEDALYFVQKGMNTVRLPFKWEYLQPDLTKSINFQSGKAAQYAALVNTLTQAGIYVMIDMHNYMRYNNQIIGVSSVTAQNYANAWKSIATQFKGNDHVIFDLMNEPYDIDTETILSNYNAAIAAIRQAGANNLILLEGNGYATIAGWNQNWYGTPDAQVFIPNNIKDPANNYAINVHEYFDNPNGGGAGMGECVDPSKVLDIEKFEAFTNWLHQTKQRAFLSELGGLASNNCVNVLHIFLTSVEANPDQKAGGFIGWSAWAAGSAWSGANNYKLYLGQNADGSEQPQMKNAIDNHLTPPTGKNKLN